MATDAPLLYTPEGAAAKIATGRTTIYALMASGELRSVKIGRSRRIPAEALRGVRHETASRRSRCRLTCERPLRRGPPKHCSATTTERDKHT